MLHMFFVRGQRTVEKPDGMSGARSTGVLIAVILAFLSILVLPILALAQASAEKGKALYAQYCAACHGPTGKGDGPAAAALNPRPRDLTDKAYMTGLKDQYLIDVTQKGGAAVDKSPLMPPWRQVLKDQDIRDVVAHIKGLAK